MATILINRAFPKSRADLEKSQAEGEVVGYKEPGSITNQQWTFPPASGQQGFINVKSVAAGGVIVGAFAEDIPKNPSPDFEYEAVVSGGGAVKDFVVEVVNGGIMICLPGGGERPDLYWTLVNKYTMTPVRLMVRNDKAPNTQIWDLKAVA